MHKVSLRSAESVFMAKLPGETKNQTASTAMPTKQAAEWEAHQAIQTVIGLMYVM